MSLFCWLKSHSTTIFLWLNPIQPPFCWLNPSQTAILCWSTPDSPTFVRPVPSGKCSAASQRYSTVRLPRDTNRTWRRDEMLGFSVGKAWDLSLTGWWLSHVEPTPPKNHGVKVSWVSDDIPYMKWKNIVRHGNHQPEMDVHSI